MIRSLILIREEPLDPTTDEVEALLVEADLALDGDDLCFEGIHSLAKLLSRLSKLRPMIINFCVLLPERIRIPLEWIGNMRASYPYALRRCFCVDCPSVALVEGLFDAETGRAISGRQRALHILRVRRSPYAETVRLKGFNHPLETSENTVSEKTACEVHGISEPWQKFLNSIFFARHDAELRGNVLGRNLALDCFPRNCSRNNGNKRPRHVPREAEPILQFDTILRYRNRDADRQQQRQSRCQHEQTDDAEPLIQFH